MTATLLRPYARDTFSYTIELTGNWAPWTFKAQLREDRDDTSPLLAAFTVDATRTGDLEPYVVFTISAATMQTIPLPPGGDRYWADFRAVAGGVEVTFAAHPVAPTENVTP